MLSKSRTGHLAELVADSYSSFRMETCVIIIMVYTSAVTAIHSDPEHELDTVHCAL